MQINISAEEQDAYIVKNSSFEKYLDPERQQMIYAMKTAVFSHQIDKIRHPRNWKEAVKERFFPAWAIKRWPVRYKTYSVEEFYPKITFPNKEVVLLIKKL